MSCSSAFGVFRESLIHAPILAFPTETGQYIRDTDASKFGLGGMLRTMWSTLSLTAVALFDPLNDATAPPNERCWPQ